MWNVVEGVTEPEFRRDVAPVENRDSTISIDDSGDDDMISQGAGTRSRDWEFAFRVVQPWIAGL